MDDAGPVAHRTAGDRVDRLAERVGARAQASAVFGAPVERDGVTVIPVARVRWGFGGGGGESDAERASGFGGGGGVKADPVGYIEVGPDGTTFRRIGRSITDPVVLLLGALAITLVTRALGSVVHPGGRRAP
ncbi:MAG: spore germination protein GerW family protein [Candidatus Limnocylindrales bacterium]